MNTSTIRTLSAAKAIGLLAFLGICDDLRAASDTVNKDVKIYIRLEPLPASLVLGVGRENHRGGIFASRYVAGQLAYRSFGLEYAYHFTSVGSDGLYAKIYVGHRQYDAGLEVNSHFVEKRGVWEYEVLGHHTANHFGAMIGYQWIPFSSSAFIQVGLGWQYNTNPVDVGGTMYGVGQSVKSRSEATGELGAGFLLN